MTSSPVVRLGGLFAGNNESFVWRHPLSGDPLARRSFLEFAQDAQRAGFDFLFLADRLGVREGSEGIHEHVAAGRPDNLAMLAALADEVDGLGLVATVNTTYTDAAQAARLFGTLNELSGGRAGWNVVTTVTSGENFSQGTSLPHADRYAHAAEVLDAARLLWRSRAEDRGAVSYRGRFAGAEGELSVAAAEHEPVIFQAGASTQSRRFAGFHADVVFTNVGFDLALGKQFRADVRRAAVEAGRPEDAVMVLPSLSFVWGATRDEARSRAQEIARYKASDGLVRTWLERIWRRSLPDIDLDGPFPASDPDRDAQAPEDARFSVVREDDDVVARARGIRDDAARRGLSIREYVIAQAQEEHVVGTAADIADHIEEWVREGASDGFIVSPPVLPGGLADFADHVTPVLRERGLLPKDPPRGSLRERLGITDTEAGA